MQDKVRLENFKSAIIVYWQLSPKLGYENRKKELIELDWQSLRGEGRTREAFSQMTPKMLSLGYIENDENGQVLKSLKKNSSTDVF